jgi:cell division protein FtsZ
MSLKIIGLGGMGCFVLRRLAKTSETELDLLLIDSDRRSVSTHPMLKTLMIGEDEHGTGGNPLKGREAAEAIKDELFNYMAKAKQVILVAGMGGGTGSSAAMIVAYVAKEMRIPCKAYVSMPFFQEGKRTEKIAELGLGALQRFTDDIVIVKHYFPKTSPELYIYPQTQEFLAFELYFHLLADLP